VRYSFLLQVKITKNKAYFFALKREKDVFLLISHASEILQKAKIMQAKPKELSKKLQF
jgi:hypothetical protein